MDTVVLLFRLIVKVAAVGGVAPQPHLRLDPIQSGSVSMQILSPCVDLEWSL